MSYKRYMHYSVTLRGFVQAVYSALSALSGGLGRQFTGDASKSICHNGYSQRCVL